MKSCTNSLKLIFVELFEQALKGMLELFDRHSVSLERLLHLLLLFLARRLKESEHWH
jgi:hypothetical protein